MISEGVFITGMFKLSSAYPEFSLSQPTIELYRERLQRLTEKEFEAAVNYHIDNCQWFPKVSELFRALRDQGLTAIDAWQRLLAAAEDGEKPEMGPATEKALAVIGGWEEFSRTSYESLHYRFKEFMAAYLEAREREGTTPEIESSGGSARQLER